MANSEPPRRRCRGSPPYHPTYRRGPRPPPLAQERRKQQRRRQSRRRRRPSRSWASGWSSGRGWRGGSKYSGSIWVPRKALLRHCSARSPSRNQAKQKRGERLVCEASLIQQNNGKTETTQTTQQQQQRRGGWAGRQDDRRHDHRSEYGSQRTATICKQQPRVRCATRIQTTAAAHGSSGFSCSHGREYFSDFA